MEHCCREWAKRNRFVLISGFDNGGVTNLTCHQLVRRQKGTYDSYFPRKRERQRSLRGNLEHTQPTHLFTLLLTPLCRKA